MTLSTTDDCRDLPRDEMYALLASRWRRYVLYCLFLYTPPVSLGRVTDSVTEFEHGEPAESLPDERLSVCLQLYHAHIPKLDAAGVVDHDRTDDTLEPGRRLSALEPQLRSAAEDDLGDDVSWPVDR